MSTFDLFHVSDEDRTRAQAHARFAAAEAAKIPDIPADLPLRPIQRVAVIGAGTMGGGIAMSLANIGLAVTLIDAHQEGLERGLLRLIQHVAGGIGEHHGAKG